MSDNHEPIEHRSSTARGEARVGHGTDDPNAASRARVLLRTGKHAEATDLLFSHLSAEPDDADALNLLPGALLGAGRHDEALILAASSAEAHPHHVGMALTYAHVASAMSQWDEAIESAENAIEVQPLSFEAYRYLAIALSKRDRLPEADAAMRRAVELGEEQGVAETELLMMKSAVLAEWPGRKEEGIAAARRAVALDPTNDRFRSILAFRQMAMRDSLGALRTSLGVLGSSPTKSGPRGTLLLALVSVQGRTIWLQFAIVFLTAAIGIGGFGDLLGAREDPRLAGHVVGLFGTVLNALMVWRIHRKLGGNKVVYRTILRTLRKFTGAHHALWLQVVAALLPLVAAVTGFAVLITIPLFVLVAAFFCYRLSDTTMARAGTRLYRP